MRQLLLALIGCLPHLMLSQSLDSLHATNQIDSLVKLSRDFTNKKDYNKAIEINLLAEKLAVENFGNNSPAYGTCCYNMGRIMFAKGNNADAERYYLHCKEIWENTLHKNHVNYPDCLHNLAQLYTRVAQYEKAETFYLEAKEIWLKTLGDRSSNYGGTLLNLGTLYWYMGLFDKAEQQYLECKAFCEKLYGRDHPRFGAVVGNLGMLYSDTGEFEKAESYMLEAQDIAEKTIGKENPSYAGNLINLGKLYYFTGQHKKSEEAFLLAKEILIRNSFKDHPNYSACLENLFVLYLHIHQHEKALPLSLEAVSKIENSLGTQHPEYAGNLVNLALINEELGRYDTAEFYYLKAKDIFEHSNKTQIDFYRNCLFNLGKFYQKTGRIAKAEFFHTQAKSEVQKALGSEHPDYARSLIELASLYSSTGQYDLSESYFKERAKINNALTIKAAKYMSEKELNNYLDKFSNSQNRTLSCTQYRPSKKMVELCYDNCLLYKGYVMNAANQVRKFSRMDSTTMSKFNKLRLFEKRLAAQYSKPFEKRDSVEIGNLEGKSNELEKELARSIQNFSKVNRHVTCVEVQKCLKNGEASIEFIKYRYYEQVRPTDSILYAALLLKAGNLNPVFIPLFEERSLDSLLMHSVSRKADYVNHLYSFVARGAEPVEKKARSLYDLIWKPLEHELVGVNKVFYSVSGLLHRLNMSAIPKTDELCLSDQFQMVALNSTRQLVVDNDIEIKNKDAVVFGGIQYEWDSSFAIQGKKELNSGEWVSRSELRFNYSEATTRGGAWNYLKWTEREISGLEDHLINNGFQVEVKRASHATEEAFKSLGTGKPSPRVIHLATHGFFFPDPKENSIDLTREDAPIFKTSNHPLIRSGLILAGGNYAWQMGRPFQSQAEDGILTAYEISQMNLSNTELVVLSACETGLGDIEGNEGVYGLQRAFKIAGAKYLIMSLWQVPDQETSVFMTTFYKNWADGKMNIPDAFRTTQKEMRERFINPYQWAGFVLVE